MNTDRAVLHAVQMEQEGADIIDIGGESTRPNSAPVSEKEEIKRVLPVIRALIKKIKIPLSIDTTKAEVAKVAIENGASIINDVSGFTRDLQMFSVAQKLKAGIVMMHSQGTPKTMQKNPRYQNVTKEIYCFLERQIAKAVEIGIPKKRIVGDPGIGFGKTVHHNLTLLNHLADFLPLGVPILVGPSRKSFIGKVLSCANEKDKTSQSNSANPLDRWEGTAAAVAISVLRGASILRVHDVAAMMRVSRVAHAIGEGKIVSI